MNKLETPPKPEDSELDEVMRKEAAATLKKIPAEILARNTSKLLIVTIQKLIEKGLLTEKSNMNDFLGFLRTTLDKTDLSEDPDFIEFTEKTLEESREE